MRVLSGVFSVIALLSMAEAGGAPAVLLLLVQNRKAVFPHDRKDLFRPLGDDAGDDEVAARLQAADKEGRHADQDVGDDVRED